ncbi:MAG: hypothetical protein OEQ53_08110, partial [Saprospiraceae bacterium]|nr:hypothetical protein [Saprospiraceae bacterium]
QRDPVTYLSVMSGDIGVLNDASDNVHYVLRVNPEQKAIEINGMTIRGANPLGSEMGTSGAPIISEGEILMNQVTISKTQ